MQYHDIVEDLDTRGPQKSWFRRWSLCKQTKIINDIIVDSHVLIIIKHHFPAVKCELPSQPSEWL